MSTKLLVWYYIAAAGVAIFVILWMLKKPSEEAKEREEVKDLGVTLPHFHHTGAYISGAVVFLVLTYLAFSNYSIGTTRQWWLIDMFDARSVKAYEQPMRLPADGAVPTNFVPNANRNIPAEANGLLNPHEVDLVDGERNYDIYCAPCHAAEGKGNGPVAKRSGGTIAGIPLAGSMARSEGFLYLTIRNGGALMPSYGWAMDDKEMWNVVAYLRSLFPAPEPVAEVQEEL